MRKQIRIVAAALFAGLLLGAVTTAQAASVGVSFVGRDPGFSLAADAVAGVVAQPFWNNISSAGDIFSGTSVPLRANAGEFTDVKLIYAANDSWHSDGPSVTPNEILMKGIQKMNPDPDGGPVVNGSDRMIFTFTNLPAGTFNVLVYLTHNGLNAEVSVNAGGAITYYVSEEAVFSGTFTRSLDTTAGTYPVGANYAQFDAVASVGGAITVTVIKNVVVPQVADGGGVAAIQFVQLTGSPLPANTTACSITTPPANATVVEGARATFSVTAAGPALIQWQKNGVNIPGAVNATYQTAPTVMADNNATFRAIVYNNVNTNTSANAVLTVVPLSVPTLTQGFLEVRRWDGVTGTSTAEALAVINAVPPVAPSTSFYVVGPNVPDQGVDNFAIQASGWIVPPVTGDYDFFIRSDDASALYLNAVAAPSGTNALPDLNTATPICEELGCCGGFVEPGLGGETTAAPITLQAGKLYGFTIVLKEGGGGDFAQVAARLSTDTTPAASLKPIPAAYCQTVVQPAGKTSVISQQPQSVVTSAGKPASFSVGVTTTPTAGMSSAQWLKNGTAIPGATANSYSILSTTLAQTGEAYSAIVYTLNGPLTSSIATLTVTSDNIPPVVLGSAAFPGSTQVGVKFDEALDPVSGGLAANYKVNGVAVLSAQVRTNVANEITNEKNLVTLTVATPLTAAFTVTVTNVKDAFGNALLNSTSPGQMIKLTSTDVGSTGADAGAPDPQLPTTVTTYGPGDFDVLTTGSNDYWNNADGMSFLWAPKTNSFDVRVRVISVSPIDNWTAGAIEVREGPVTPNGGGWELARHYFCKANYGGPGAVPCLDNANNDGNDSFEFNCRLAPGDPAIRETGNGGSGGSRGWGGTGPGNPSPVPFPDAWIRIARVKNGTSDHMLGYTGTDGINWSLRQDVDLNDAAHAGFVNDLTGLPAGPWPDVCYVGLGSVSHTGIGNNNAENTGVVGEYWYSKIGAPYSAFIIYRDYGDTPSATVPTISETRNVNGTITIVFTGVLYSSETVNGTYVPVASATSPLVINPATSGKTAVYYKAGP